MISIHRWVVYVPFVAAICAPSATAAQQGSEAEMRKVAVRHVVGLFRGEWDLKGALKLSGRIAGTRRELPVAEVADLRAEFGLSAGEVDEELTCPDPVRPMFCRIPNAVAAIQVGEPVMTSDSTAVLPVRTRFEAYNATEGHVQVHRRWWDALLLRTQEGWIVVDLQTTLATD